MKSVHSGTSLVPGAGELLDGRYELVELAGSGGMADVWRALDTRLGRAVAVKLLSGPSAREASLRRRIEREAFALASLSHPNIVAVYDYGEADHDGGVIPYLVMELVDGLDLHRYLETHGPLESDEATRVLRGVLAGVECAHAAGIVHGDLKPANVLFSSDGPKVSDFGVARILANETGTTTIAATPSFAAPEVLRGEKPTPASDVYSVGCLAFQMLVGHPPYEGSSPWLVAAKHAEEPIPSVRDTRPDVGPKLGSAIERAMAKQPRRRHVSAEAFAAALSAPRTTLRLIAPGSNGHSTRQSTERLPDRPDLGAVALLGPVARFRDRGGALHEWWRDFAGRRLLVLGVIAVLAFVSMLLFIEHGSTSVTVPDVRGMDTAQASKQLGSLGLRDSVSYRPITSGDAGVVLETVPAPGERVEKGSGIYLIASALARTPEPAQPAAAENVPKGKGHGREKD